MNMDNFIGIPGFNRDYKIDKSGNILSIRRDKILKPHKRRHGYLAVELYGKSYSVHRLVALTFIEKPLGKDFVNHKNGIKNDNRAENLEWCTQSENCRHSFSIGLQCNKGEQNPQSKITLADSIEIKQLIKDGNIYQREIAKRFNISEHLVSKIKTGKLWNY